VGNEGRRGVESEEKIFENPVSEEKVGRLKILLADGFAVVELKSG
jgi:hypothetical protein